MIWVTGDTHGDMDIHKLASNNFVEGTGLTKKDYVIIAGDFGLIWYPDGSKASATEQHWREWLRDKPWTTLFVDGNHENHVMLNELPRKQMFGAEVGVVNDSIYHLRRGHVYTIDGQKIWTFGGGYSIDKARRQTYVSWWPEEMPNHAEMEFGLSQLEAHNYDVDYVVTHTCPDKIFWRISQLESYGYKIRGEETLRGYFEEVYQKLQFKQWFFGHFHSNYIINQEGKRFRLLYEKIVPMEG